MQTVFLPHYWQSTRLLMAKNIQCIFSSLSTTCIFPSLLAKYTDHVFTSLWQSTQTILYVINRKYVETVLYTPILWNTQFWCTLMQSTQTVLHRPYNRIYTSNFRQSAQTTTGKAHRPYLLLHYWQSTHRTRFLTQYLKSQTRTTTTKSQFMINCAKCFIIIPHDKPITRFMGGKFVYGYLQM